MNLDPAINNESTKAQFPASSAKRGSGRLPRGKRVGQIETAARVVFCRRGYADASIAEIAAEAGIAEGTIYKFFESKRHLVTRVIELWYEYMLGEFEKSLAGISGAKNKIRFIVWRHLAFLKEDIEIARLCLNEARSSRDYYQSELYKLNRSYTHVLLDACREGISNGELRSDTSITMVRDLIFGGIDHHTAAMLCGRSVMDVNQSADSIMTLVFAGIQNTAPTQAASGETCSRLERVAERIEAIVMHMEKR